MGFEVLSGDITNIEADAIVLPANSRLKEGGGTSAAIFAAAGRKRLEKACECIGYCRVGGAAPNVT